MKHKACDDGWTAYKDEKCIKVLPDVSTFDEAEKRCFSIKDSNGNTSDVRQLTVSSKEENKFLAELFFSQDYMALSKEIWLGARGFHDTWTGTWYFRWHRNYATEEGIVAGNEFGKGDSPFTNWVKGSPGENQDESYCVVMIPNNNYEEQLNGTFLSFKKLFKGHDWKRGQWLDEKCDRLNLVACERDQKWSTNKLTQKLILLQVKK